VIHENWNDPYYVGLDSIEFLDAKGCILDVLACGGSIQALPHSVAILAQEDRNTAQLATDPRSPCALLSSSTSSHLVRPSGCRCWLAPLTRRMSDAEKKKSAGPQLHTVSTVTNTSSNQYLDSKYCAKFPQDNCLYVMFPYPVAISCVRVANYSKTPARGVKELSLYVDGRLVYMGNIKQGTDILVL